MREAAKRHLRLSHFTCGDHSNSTLHLPNREEKMTVLQSMNIFTFVL